MEKRKYDLSKYADEHREACVRGEDGTEVTVRDHIPYAEKENMAHEMAERLIVIHEDSCVFQNSEYDKVKKFLTAKYYTDIDTEDMTEEEVADFMMNNEVWRPVESECGWDLSIVCGIYDAIFKAVKDTFEDDKSITKALRTSFGFLFNGEDVTESLAKAEIMKNTVYEAISAWNKAEKDKEETIDNGTLKVGGNVLNFAKKE